MRVILFNLFPYRERRNEATRRMVLCQIGVSAVLALVVAGLVNAEFQRRYSIQDEYLMRLGRLEEDLTRKVAQVQQQRDRVLELKRQIKALEDVEAQSVVASELMAFLDESLPMPVGLNRLVLREGELAVEGYTSSVSELAAWVARLELEDELFHTVDLVYVRTTPSEDQDGRPSGMHQFEIKAVLKGGANGTSTGRI
ncbi:PilN domain-containing protein [Limnobacter sp.]|uniref:PilN domain-containing protein n=1 Tax=Limnobacter sp. TaxID=2003368 RepID=UPI0035170760